MNSEIVLEPWQYRLTAEPHPDAIAIGDYWMSVGAGLPMITVKDHQGRYSGVLLGFPIDLITGKLMSAVWVAPESANLSSESGVHRALRSIGGIYIWVCLTPTFHRIYPDAITQVTCVWDTLHKSVGSTARSILHDEAYDLRFDRNLFQRLAIIGEGWFPAGLTAHSDIHRLLPNHYFDLQTWTAHRMAVVPVTGMVQTPDEIVDTFVDIVQRQIGALAEGPQRLVVALTAGRDSRAVLACARQWADQITAVTVTGEDRHQVDTIVAKQIADGTGIAHRSLPRQIADQAAQDLFLKRGGHCFGDSNMKYHPSIAPLAETCIFVGGLGGEIARAVYWRNSDTPDMAITPALVMGRLGLPREPKVETFIQAWLEDLPTGITAQTVWDLVYLELRQGPWGTAQFCADPTLVRHAPLMTYDTVALMLALPDDWKVHSRLNAAIVERLWPDLAQFPYNTVGRLQDFWIGVRRVLDDPSLVVKKLRKRFA